MRNEVSLYEAKTHLSSLVDRASMGEEIVITKKGQPKARLLAAAAVQEPREFGKNVMGLRGVDLSFLDPDPEITALFDSSDSDEDLFRTTG